MRRLNREIKQRTLEEVATILDANLEFKKLRGNKCVWQVKLGKVYLYRDDQWKGGLSKERAVCKNENPNYALRRLCDKLSYKTVVAPQVKGEDVILSLGEVIHGPLYLRLCEGM